ncbi:MAG TPA: lipopolysaccharide assembly protein LapA domain-containing protein [Afipia sp.]
MGKFFKTLVIVPLALILLAFAVANRQIVMVSFNPFDSGDTSLALTLPLFIVIIAAAVIGVIAGGIAVWFGQRRWRRAARRFEAEASEARQKLADWNAHIPLAPAGDRLMPVASTSPYQRAPLAIGQDKGGAAL